jgi:hypothetical protein
MRQARFLQLGGHFGIDLAAPRRIVEYNDARLDLEDENQQGFEVIPTNPGIPYPGTQDF